MFGPVFHVEMLRAGRRGRAHVLRWIYAGWLCLQLVYMFDATHAPPSYQAPRPPPTKAAANFGRQYRDLVLGQQFILIILVTPAFVAGAVTDEKTRGTLQGLLTAYVTPADVVLGKLAARCAQVAVLALVPLPLLAVVGQYAGITPEFLVILTAVTVLVLFGLGGTSMLASVWFRQTRNAVIATYLALAAGAWLLDFAVTNGWLAWEWKGYFDPLRPLWLTLDRDEPAEAFRRLGQAALAWGSLGLVTTSFAVWRLRPAYLRQMESRPRRLTVRGFGSRPRPVRDVVAWKECYVGRRVPQWIGVPIVIAVAGAVTASSFYWTGSPSGRGVAVTTLSQVGVWSFVLATLVVGVRCSGSITGEREKHTWDGLMTSPMTVREIVNGKHRGVIRATWPYVLAAWFGAASVTGLAAHYDPTITIGFALTALGVGGLTVRFAPRAVWWASIVFILLMAGTVGLEAALIVAVYLGATWAAMYFIGAVGMGCSARMMSSWRSLLATVVLGYGGGAALSCVSSIVGCVFLAIGSVIQQSFRNGFERDIATVLFALLSVGALGWVYWMVARSVLTSAGHALAVRDRIPPGWIRMMEMDLSRHGPPRSRDRLRG